MSVQEMIAESVADVKAGRCVGATIIDGNQRHEVRSGGKVETFTMTPEEVQDYADERAYYDAKAERKAARS